MSDIIDYYKKYYVTHGDSSYTMQKMSESSRVLTLIDWIKKHVPEGGRILDVGCGDMYLATQLPQYEWLGLDLNTDRAKGEALECDLMKPPYPAPGKFDAAVCSEVLEHVWDLRIVHKEMKRLIKKDGYYFVSTPNFEWIDHTFLGFRQLIFDANKPWLFEHVRQYSYEAHKHYLQEAGFSVEYFCGADGHYSGFFNPGRAVLSQELKDLGLELSEGQVDQIVGRMFPYHNHTIMLKARSV